ncbi:hypothetical protein FOL47_004748 [Perkinsus chesapeaki]|uniref:Uncharacterized protein n=1 Tax=Perkinsus chesapeaki TaxID=330153 RepID=A0A7J6MZJ8_PERCH|nr:hypothetical protein FOL47_004748 [Perkinsus chesapeaki]
MHRVPVPPPPPPYCLTPSSSRPLGPPVSPEPAISMLASSRDFSNRVKMTERMCNQVLLNLDEHDRALWRQAAGPVSKKGISHGTEGCYFHECVPPPAYDPYPRRGGCYKVMRRPDVVDGRDRASPGGPGSNGPQGRDEISMIPFGVLACLELDTMDEPPLPRCYSRKESPCSSSGRHRGARRGAAITLGILATAQELLPLQVVRPIYPILLLLCLSPRPSKAHLCTAMVTILQIPVFQKLSSLVDWSGLGLLAFSFIKAGFAEECVKCIGVACSCAIFPRAPNSVGLWAALSFSAWENFIRGPVPLLTDSFWVELGSLAIPTLVHLFCTQIAIDPESDFGPWSLGVAALCHGVYDMAALTYVPLCPVVLLGIVLLSEASHFGRDVMTEKVPDVLSLPV